MSILLRPTPTPTLFPYTTLFRSLMTAQTLRFTPVLARLRDRLQDVGVLEYHVLAMRADRPPHRWLGDPSQAGGGVLLTRIDRKSTRLNSSYGSISYAVFCLKKKK